MLKRIFALALVFCCLAGGVSARPLHGVPSGGGGGSPVVIPGATQPVGQTSDHTITFAPGYNTITPVSHGSPSDNGYALRGSSRWGDYPFQEIGRPGVSVSRQIAFYPYHLPTDVEKAAGLISNISSAQVRCDNGSFQTISGPTTNPDAGGESDWNFTVTTGAGWPDGLHKCDLDVSPTTGPDVIVEGPATDQYGNMYEEVKATAATISNGTSMAAGNILTVFTMPSLTIMNHNGAVVTSNVLSIGMSVGMRGAAADTFIDGDSTHNQTACVAQTGSNCTGAGGVGTYHVTQSSFAYGGKFTGAITTTSLNVTAFTDGGISAEIPVFCSGCTAGTHITDYNSASGNTGTYVVGTSQTVSSQIMWTATSAVFNVARSFYFFTNYNGTLSRPLYFVSLSGNDSTGNGTSGNPYLTVGKAILQAQTVGTSGGRYGGVVCLMGGGSFAYSNFSNVPWADWGYLQYQSANTAPCSLGSDPGGATITNDNSSRQFFGIHTAWKDMKFSGVATNLDPGGAATLTAINVTDTQSELSLGGVLGSGAAYCFNSLAWFGTDGLCSGAIFLRGNTGKYYNADGAHDIPMIVSNIYDGGGPTLFWATGTTTSGSALISNVAFPPSELAGHNISAIFGNPFTINFVKSSDGVTECFTGYPLHAGTIDETNHTIQVLDSGNNPVTANATCTGYMEWPGSHGDMWQLQIGNPEVDVVAMNNNWGANFPGFQQGQFIENAQTSGGYIVNNTWKSSALTSEQLINNKGSDELLIESGNTYASGQPMAMDIQQISRDSLFSGDVCPLGQTLGFTVSGATNIRRKAAASQACYTTTTP